LSEALQVYSFVAILVTLLEKTGAC
jgi:hypothetical protein